MASSTFLTTLFHLHRLTPPPSPSKPRFKLTPRATTASLSDPLVLQIAETLEDSLPPSSTLQKLRNTSSQSLLSLSWPTRKDESFRFTDTSFIKNSQIHPKETILMGAERPKADYSDLVIVDGVVSDNVMVKNGCYIGRLSGLEDERMLKRVYECMGEYDGGDLFWSLNGVGAPEVAVIYVGEGCKVEESVGLRFYSRESGEVGEGYLPMSNPRVLVVVEKGGEVEIVEEYMSGDEGDKCYWTNSAVEILVGEGGTVRHSYVQRQSVNAAHIKWTYVRQEASSLYQHVEISTGGKLSRHNLHVQQVGPDTVTEMSTFHLCVHDQTQDLHSKLVLDHPRGSSKQLHKCIVAHSSGHAVFDGNVKVNRYAQKTDAGQLTRSLLLEPRATVNVKPNLQIIADDVKCSHGASISDLEEDQIFYFSARGIDSNTARRALILSFGAEVISRLPSNSLQKQVQSHIRGLLVLASQ